MNNKKPFSIERRPKLLKDFLSETSNSCSSSGFKSFPRHQLQTLDSSSRNSNSNSKSVSAFQSLINVVVKNITFTAVKSPSFLPKSLSRKLSRKESNKPTTTTKENKVKIAVRVKDILRWTSFRDVVEEKSLPSDFSPSPNHYTTTTTGSIDSSYSDRTKSSSFSWCESDFTAELLPSWSGKIFDVKELEEGKNKLPCVGVECVEAKIDTPSDLQDEEDVLLYENEDDDEQQSPVSVFGFEYEENEETLLASAFDQSLVNVERTRQNLIEKIKQFESLSNSESVESEKRRFAEDEEDEEDYSHIYGEEETEEERARELLLYVKATTSSTNKTFLGEDEKVLIDFFRNELKEQSCCFNYSSEIVSLAKAWVSGDFEAFGFEHHNGEAYFREMNKLGDWSKFEVEQNELALQIGDTFVGQLVDELLFELLVK